MEQIDVVYKLTERYPDNFQIALTASGMSGDASFRSNSISISISFERECTQRRYHQGLRQWQGSFVDWYRRRSFDRLLTRCTASILSPRREVHGTDAQLQHSMGRELLQRHSRWFVRSLDQLHRLDRPANPH